MIWENVRIALRAIRAHRLRSLLATLGIVIGVAAVIAVVSIVQGFSGLVTNAIEGLGTNAIIAFPNRPPGKEGLKLTKIGMTAEDAQAVRDQIPMVEDVAPAVQQGAMLRYKEEQVGTTLVGTTPSFQTIRGYYVDRGRFPSAIDEKHRKKVCVVGVDVVKNLVIQGDPIGKQIEINRVMFTIIGVMEEKGRLFGQPQDDLVFIPFRTALQLYGPGTESQVGMQVKTRKPEDVEPTVDRMTEILRRRHSLRSDQPNDFIIFSQKEALETFSTVSRSATFVVAGIAFVALVVGGIGIMNIMLVSVTERTREIGLRKALGARRSSILQQFLIEATVLSVVGGAIGIALGTAAGFGITELIPGDATAKIPLWAVAVSFLISAGTGIVMGFYPAVRASGLDPVEALRFE